MSEDVASVGSDAVVSLREVTAETVRTICELAVKPHQTRFVAPNAVSIAEAYFEPHAWFRAIYADETPVGFVMLDDNPEEHDYFLWRFMIAGPHQGKGFGKQALRLVVDYVKTRPGARVLETSYVPGDGSPAGFYIKFGFQETGELDGDERIMFLPLLHQRG